jgi:hypothetical protein
MHQDVHRRPGHPVEAARPAESAIAILLSRPRARPAVHAVGGGEAGLVVHDQAGEVSIVDSAEAEAPGRTGEPAGSKRSPGAIVD